MASDEEYVLSKDFVGEHERLQLLEAHVDPLSIMAIEAAGIEPGYRCLEIGAGAGSIARWLVNQTGDASLVFAIDLDTRLLAPLVDLGITVLQHDFSTGRIPCMSRVTSPSSRVVKERIARYADWLTLAHVEGAGRVYAVHAPPGK